MNEGNLRRVRAIVTAGVDIDCRNEYGQTPLFLACWYNCVSALHYLIEIGADPHITDNAGVMPSHLCQMLARNEIIQYLPPPVADSWSLYRPPQESEMPSGSVRILIDPHEAHPGAGSFIADGFLSDNFLAALRNLHQMLPEAIPTKLSCSRRSYYCDATRWVRRELGCALRSIARLIIGSSIGQSVEHSVVSEALPHMRFLEVCSITYFQIVFVIIMSTYALLFFSIGSLVDHWHLIST